METLLFAGIVISLLVTEFTGYSPGGVVAAGYLAMFLDRPLPLVETLVAALATFGIVRLLDLRLILYGRRRFTVFVLTGMLVSQGAMLLTQGGAVLGAGILSIGVLVPGLIARDFDRQGVIPTLPALVLAVVLTRLAGLVIQGF
jgi:poly-gamma-glutamate biosynthesis protein PgsC/CapC